MHSKPRVASWHSLFCRIILHHNAPPLVRRRLRLPSTDQGPRHTGSHGPGSIPVLGRGCVGAVQRWCLMWVQNDGLFKLTERVRALCGRRIACEMARTKEPMLLKALRMVANGADPEEAWRAGGKPMTRPHYDHAVQCAAGVSTAHGEAAEAALRAQTAERAQWPPRRRSLSSPPRDAMTARRGCARRRPRS